MSFNLEDMSFSFECLGFSSEGLNFSTEALGTEGNEKHHTHCLFNHSRAIVLQYNDAHCLHHEAVGHRPREPGQSELPVAIHAAIHVCSHKGNSRSFPLRVNVPPLILFFQRPFQHQLARLADDASRDFLGAWDVVRLPLRGVGRFACIIRLGAAQCEPSGPLSSKASRPAWRILLFAM